MYIYRLIAVSALVVVLLGMLLYAGGWLNVQQDERKATIEIQTGEMQDAANKAVDKGRELIHEAARSVEASTSPGSDNSNADRPRSGISSGDSSDRPERRE